MRGRQALASRVEPGTAIRATWAFVLGNPGLPADATTELQDRSVLREMPCGALLISRRDSARDLVLIARGDAALGSAQNDAPFHPERTVHGPDWVDASSTWLGGTHAQDAIALTDVQLITIPRPAMQQALLRHSEIARRLVLALSRQVHALTEVAHDLMHKDAETRFAAWLLHRCVADAVEPGTAVVALHERKRDIAAQLAITPETLSRLLRHLSRKGLIEVRGYTVRVLDLAALQRLAGS